MFVPPLALNHANNCCSATSGVTSDAAVESGLIAGPRYVYCSVAGLPAADDESAIELLMPATYFAKLPVTAHTPFPVGSHTTPRRGLNALSLATTRPALSLPLFLSHRM